MGRASLILLKEAKPCPVVTRSIYYGDSERKAHGLYKAQNALASIL